MTLKRRFWETFPEIFQLCASGRTNISKDMSNLCNSCWKSMRWQNVGFVPKNHRRPRRSSASFAAVSALTSIKNRLDLSQGAVFALRCGDRRPKMFFSHAHTRKQLTRHEPANLRVTRARSNFGAPIRC